MLNATRMASFFILHPMANGKGVARENISAVVLGSVGPIIKSLVIHSTIHPI